MRLLQGVGEGGEILPFRPRQLRNRSFPSLRRRAVVRGIRIHAGARDRVPVHPKFSGELFGSNAPKEPIRGLAKCRFHFMVADLLRTGSNTATLILCARAGESKSFGISAGEINDYGELQEASDTTCVSQGAGDQEEQWQAVIMGASGIRSGRILI